MAGEAVAVDDRTMAEISIETVAVTTVETTTHRPRRRRVTTRIGEMMAGIRIFGSAVAKTAVVLIGDTIQRVRVTRQECGTTVIRRGIMEVPR